MQNFVRGQTIPCSSGSGAIMPPKVVERHGKAMATELKLAIISRDNRLICSRIS